MSKKSTKNKIFVKSWGSYDEVSKRPIAIGSFGGFFSDGMRGQKDYFDLVDENEREYFEALREEIINNNIKISGYCHQHRDDGIPIFSDGKIAEFSFRGWGDLMAAIWSEEEDEDYNYMDFYMNL